MNEKEGQLISNKLLRNIQLSLNLHSYIVRSKFKSYCKTKYLIMKRFSDLKNKNFVLNYGKSVIITETLTSKR